MTHNEEKTQALKTDPEMILIIESVDSYYNYIPCVLESKGKYVKKIHRR